MNTNEKHLNISNLSTVDLITINRHIDEFLFKEIGGEPFESSFRKDPKIFKKLISEMLDFKTDLMRYWKKQYQNYTNLVKTNRILSEFDDYLYDDNWDDYDDELTAILENHTQKGYDYGAIALAISLGILFDHSSADAESIILKRAHKVAGDINTVTKKRAIAQVKASLELGEDRDALEERLRKVFNNAYRGRFIAQQETLNAYMEGKAGLAEEQDLPYKVALSSQATDRICGDINGEVVRRNESFSNGFLQPLYHYGCKCDITYSRNSDGS